MERRYRVRLDELLEDAEVTPSLLRGVLPRLEAFLQPFARSLLSAEQRTNAQQYVQGLLSDLPSKDAESIAYLHDRERQGLQKFLGQSPWDHRPLLDELTAQVAARLGQPDGVLVFDPSAFPKKGAESAGVARQWCGRLGKLDNCQVAVYLGHVSRVDHALVDFRLYLPREWAADGARRTKAGIPREARFRTRHELALAMLDQRGPRLPHAWVAGDDEMGRSSRFRRQLRSRGEQYLLAVPSNTLVRDLTEPEPEYHGRGRKPRVPFRRLDRWRASLPESAWETIEIRDGEKGPLVVQGVKTLVEAKTEGKPSGEVEWLVAFRERQGDGTWKHDYLLGWAALTTPLGEFARVFNAGHRVEECLKRAKGKAGLADYQVRTWEGWHHHQTLALLATWFLSEEARRGKKADPRIDGAASAGVAGGCVEAAAEERERWPYPSYGEPAVAPQRGGAAIPLATAQPLAASQV